MRPALLAAAVLLSACFAPKPCTRALCVARLDGTMEVSAWNGVFRATADGPKPPVMSDAEVRMVYGKADFVNGTTRVTAEEGSVFAFSVSTGAVPSIAVTTGTVSVWLSTVAPTAVPPGAPFLLPKAR